MSDTWESVKRGMTVSVIVAFIIGAVLIDRDSSPNFLSLYFTQAVPVGLTLGGLTFYISELIKRRDKGTRAISPSKRHNKK